MEGRSTEITNDGGEERLISGQPKFYFLLLSKKFGISVFIAVNLILWPILIVFVFLKSSSTNSSTNADNFIMTSIFPTSWSITGVRQGVNGNIVLTGGTGPPSLEHANQTKAYIYYGPIEEVFLSDSSSAPVFHVFNTTIAGETVLASYFYGPNTAYYDSRIGENNIVAVGAYSYLESEYQGSFIYDGPVNGTGTFTKIKINPKIINGTYPNGSSFSYVDEVALTVAHSTMGDFIVGNVYFASSAAKGYGLIYNRFTGTYQLIERGYSTTLYGIWQNNGQYSDFYTIIGGHSNSKENGTAFDVAFIENYDSALNTFSDLRDYWYLNNNSYRTHFEGVSAVAGGYTVAAEVVTAYLPSMAFIPTVNGTAFGEAVWTPIVNSLDGYRTTSDTVLGNLVFGIYYEDPDATLSSPFSAYIYNVSATL